MVECYCQVSNSFFDFCKRKDIFFFCIYDSVMTCTLSGDHDFAVTNSALLTNDWNPVRSRCLRGRAFTHCLA